MKVIDVLESPWAIVPEKLAEIREIYDRRMNHPKLDIEEIRAVIVNGSGRRERGYVIEDGVAIIQIEGVLGKKMNIFTEISGGASTQLIGADFAQAMNDPQVHSVLLYVDSPGGTVDGTQALADLIYNARGKKPIVAIADGMAASAAYWIGSAADQFFISGDTTLTGSIGVVAQHTDISTAEEKRGIKVTEITAGKYKRIASEHAPLTDEGRASIQERVDHLYSVFVDNVAKNRGVSSDLVASDMADGRLFVGKQAVKAGLVDGVSTPEAAIASLTSKYDSKRIGAVAHAAKIHLEGGHTMADKDNKEIVLTEEIRAKIAPELDAAKAASKAEGVKEGVEAERKRIQGIEEVAAKMPGHDDLVKEMKFDGKTTRAEAMERLIDAEDAKKKKIVTDIRTGAAAAVPSTAVDDPTKKEGEKTDAAKAGTDKGADGIAFANKMSAEADVYQAEMKAKGLTVSNIDAIKFVYKRAGVPQQ